MDLTVITATCQRPQLLAHCLREYQRQSLGELKCEHLVVSDGPNPVAKFLSDRFGAVLRTGIVARPCRRICERPGNRASPRRVRLLWG